MTTCSGSDRNWLSRRLATLVVGIGVCTLAATAQPAQAVCVGAPNGIVQAGEICDDGNLFNGDGCSTSCTLEPLSCMDDVSGLPHSANCTANDVSLSLIAQVQESDGCSFPGDTAQVQMQAHLIATSRERYDIGIFIALDGGTGRTGSCHHNYLPPPLAPPGVLDVGSPLIGNGGTAFFDAELTEDPADSCGDLAQGVNNYYDLEDYGFSDVLQTLTIVCVDTDDNGLVDVGSCLSWDNGKSKGTNQAPSCDSVLDTVPSTVAKCRCETLNTTLAFPGKILVNKVTVPDPDPTNPDTLFDFVLSGGPNSVNFPFSLSNGQTGPNPPVNCSTVDPTDCNYQRPGTGYSVVETPEEAWTTTVECKNQSNVIKADPTNFSLAPNEIVTCTFTNTNLCAGKDCNDSNECTADSCDQSTGQCVNTATPGTACGDQTDGVCDDPNTCDANGVCQPNLAAPTTICRPGSGDICDPDESCDGAGSCPADIVSAATTVCNPGSGDICDPAESCTGVTGAACPTDTIAAATTICNPGSGDVCDPARAAPG